MDYHDMLMLLTALAQLAASIVQLVAALRRPPVVGERVAKPRNGKHPLIRECRYICASGAIDYTSATP